MPKTYMLKTIRRDRTSYNGFVWPESGRVESLDWNPEPECGDGLHGALMGEGDGSLFDWDNDAIWLVLEVDSATIVDLGGKIKVPYCDVIYSGNRKTATDMMIKLGGKYVIGSSVASGDGEISTSGYHGKSISGRRGYSISGFCGKSISGFCGKSISGDKGISISGEDGESISGFCGKSISGFCGKSISGDYGESISRDKGISISGDFGVSIAGEFGIAASGHGGAISICYHDGTRIRIIDGYVGEDGIDPNVQYEVVDGVMTRRDK